MIIKLPWIEPIDTLHLPANFEWQVKESFRQFTQGTAKEYQFEDKLSYLDNLRRCYMRNDDTEKAIDNLIAKTIRYELDEYGTMPDKEEILSTEFMEQCYDKGFRPLRDEYEPYSHSQNTETLKVIFRIVQIVSNYEEEVKKDG